MITTSTSKSKLSHLNQETESISGETLNGSDLLFYESIKSQLDLLSKEPEDETISRILDYSKSL